MKNEILIFTLILLPLAILGQIKVEGIYPTNQYSEGNVTLILSNDDSNPWTGYTSFQIIGINGDTLTKETGPDYNLPQKKSKQSYQLELIEGTQNLPDSLCGTLVFKNPEYELEFCLDNHRQLGTPTGDFCSEFEIVDILDPAEYWDNMITVLLTTRNPNGTQFTGYTYFQLFDSNNDSLMIKTGPNYITPMFNTDTIAYNFTLLDEIELEPENIDSMCFELYLNNPDCKVKSCLTSNYIEAKSNLPIVIFPNPSSDYFIINGLSDKSLTKLYDLTGKEVDIENQNNNRFTITQYKKGIYFLQISESGKVLTTKRIVKM